MKYNLGETVFFVLNHETEPNITCGRGCIVKRIDTTTAKTQYLIKTAYNAEAWAEEDDIYLTEDDVSIELKKRLYTSIA